MINFFPHIIFRNLLSNHGHKLIVDMLIEFQSIDLEIDPLCYSQSH